MFGLMRVLEEAESKKKAASELQRHQEIEKQKKRHAEQYDRIKKQVEEFSMKAMADAIQKKGDNLISGSSNFHEVFEEEFEEQVVLSKLKKYGETLLSSLGELQSAGHECALALMVRLELIYEQEIKKVETEEVVYSRKHWKARSKELKALCQNSNLSIEAQCLSKLARVEVLFHLGEVEKSKQRCDELECMIPRLDEVLSNEMLFRIGCFHEKYGIENAATSGRSHASSISSISSDGRRERSLTLSSGGRNSFTLGSLSSTPERKVSLWSPFSSPMHK